MTKQHATQLQRTGVRPVWSRVTMEEADRGVRLILPAVGLWRCRKDVPWAPGQSLFWASAVFCLIVALLTGFFLLAAQNTPAKDSTIPWPIWAGLGGFWGVGLAALLGGLNLCRRQGSVEVTDHVLRAEQVSPLGRRQWEWPRQQIAAVQSGPTGLTIGGGTRPAGVRSPGGIGMAELHLYFEGGGRIRLFAGRAAQELDWIAGELRGALQVGTKHYDGG